MNILENQDINPLEQLEQLINQVKSTTNQDVVFIATTKAAEKKLQELALGYKVICLPNLSNSEDDMCYILPNNKPIKFIYEGEQ